MTSNQPGTETTPTPTLGAIPATDPIEGNDPFGLRRFSLKRYSVRHMLLMSATVVILCIVTVRAIWAQEWFILGLSAASLTLMTLILFLVIRTTVRRVVVEQWIRRLGMGDFEYTVEPWGNDELSECCVALETLRLRAIEAMQLDLVRSLSKELQEKNEELENALEELKRTQDRIVSQQKLAELGELSAGVAHEIRNPLQFIRNFAEDADSVAGQLSEVAERMALQAAPDERQEIVSLTGQLKENMGRVVRNTDRADRVVADMLALHRDSKREFAPVDLNRLVEQQTMVACRTAQASMEGFGVDAAVDLDPDIGEVAVIQEDLARVIFNLVTNACQATAEKARKSGPGGYGPALRVSTRRTGDSVEIHVRDNGHGMSQEVMEKIFNPFFTTKEPGQGTGLGLSLCHDVAREHGGTIEAESKEGEYTLMVLKLPSQGEEPANREDSSDQSQVEELRPVAAPPELPANSPVPETTTARRRAM